MGSIIWEFYFLCGEGTRPFGCTPDNCVQLMDLIASFGDQVWFKEMCMGALVTKGRLAMLICKS